MESRVQLRAAFEQYDSLRRRLGVSLPGQCIFWRETMSQDYGIGVYADGVGGASWVLMRQPNLDPTSDDCISIDSGNHRSESAAIKAAQRRWRKEFPDTED